MSHKTNKNQQCLISMKSSLMCPPGTNITCIYEALCMRVMLWWQNFVFVELLLKSHKNGQQIIQILSSEIRKWCNPDSNLCRQHNHHDSTFQSRSAKESQRNFSNQCLQGLMSYFTVHALIAMKEPSMFKKMTFLCLSLSLQYDVASL